MITKVVVHPLVLLSTVDHYNRTAKDTNKRVCGVLLGEISKGEVDITNSFAIPFEEEDNNSSIWYLDHNFLENMGAMYKKVNARENVVGWYSTGPKIRPNDLEINDLFKRYTPNPVFVIIDVAPKEEFQIPTKSYIAIEEVKENSTETPTMQFKHIPSVIGALEAEEVGVEHLLRDVKDSSVSSLATKVHGKLLSLKSLVSHLQEMHQYLQHVISGKVPLNHQILSNMQDIFNLAPNIDPIELAKSFAVKTNDYMLVIYLSSLIRSIIALHSLINNKIDNRNHEKAISEAGSKQTSDKESTTKSIEPKNDPNAEPNSKGDAKPEAK